MTTPTVLKHAHLCTLQQLDARMASWHEAKYGSPAPLNKPRTFAKLIEEVGEFAEAWNNYYMNTVRDPASPPGDLGTRKAQVLEELSDIVLVCLNLSRAVGGGLPQAILDKLEVIHNRMYADERMGRKLVDSVGPSGVVTVATAVGPIEAIDLSKRTTVHDVENALSPAFASHPLDKAAAYDRFRPVAGVSVEEGSP